MKIRIIKNAHECKVVDSDTGEMVTGIKACYIEMTCSKTIVRLDMVDVDLDIEADVDENTSGNDGKTGS